MSAERYLIYLYLIDSRWVFVMVKGGNKNSQGMDMVQADIELILQHAGPFITHIAKCLFPSQINIPVEVPKQPN